MATGLPIFISHNYKDNAFCEKLVAALKSAGADVWYDEHNMESGLLMETIMKELGRRKIFIVILSKDAFGSKWVRREAIWAYQLAEDDLTRTILPITAGPIDPTDFSPEEGWFFLKGFKRVEAPGYLPLAADEAIHRVMHALALTPAGEAPAPVEAQPGESASDLIIRGIALRGQKKYDDALKLFERAVQLDPNSANAWFNVGYSHDAVGDFPQALVAWDRAINLDRDNAAAWTNKGSTLLKLQRYQEALDAFMTAIRIKDTYVFAWNGKGIALKELGRAEEAIDAYDKALELDPRFAYAWNGKGSALWSLQRLGEALKAFEQALVISPRIAMVWRNKAGVLNEQGQFDEGLIAAERAITLEPRSSMAWQRKADALRGLGRIRDADVAEGQAHGGHR
jgi:tetratricopeptide (TPR) repeat protein